MTLTFDHQILVHPQVQVNVCAYITRFSKIYGYKVSECNIDG